MRKRIHHFKATKHPPVLHVLAVEVSTSRIKRRLQDEGITNQETLCAALSVHAARTVSMVVGEQRKRSSVSS